MWDSMIDQVWRCESSQSQCQLTTKYTAYIQELYVWETHKSNTLTQYLYLSMTFGYFYTKLGVTKYQEDDLLHCTCLHLYQTVCLHPVEFPFAQEVILICNKKKKKEVRHTHITSSEQGTVGLRHVHVVVVILELQMKTDKKTQWADRCPDNIQLRLSPSSFHNGHLSLTQISHTPGALTVYTSS